MKPSYQRYYQANRDKILSQMRERARVYREKAKENPEEMREAKREQYYNRRTSTLKQRLEEMLVSEKVNETGKAFVRHYLLPNVAILTPGFVDVIDSLSIIDASKIPDNKSPDLLYGGQ